MSQVLTTLYNELESAISNKSLTLPNSKVSAVDVNSFLQNILKTSKVSFTDASVALADSTLTLSSDWSVFGVSLQLTWTFTDDSGDVSWTFSASSSDTTKLNTLVSHFLSEVPKMPSAVSNGSLSSITLSAAIDKSSGNYRLDLDAKTSWGEAELLVKDDGGDWGAAFGIDLESTVKLSSISSDLGAFDDLSFTDSAIIIADFDDESLTIAGITGVIKGIEFRSTLSLNASSKSGSALTAIVNELAKSLSGTPIGISIDLSADDFKLEATIANDFSMPRYSKLTLSGVTLSIDTTPSAALSGHLNVPVTIPASPKVTSLGVDGAISFTYSAGTGSVEATLNSDTIINAPFGIKGVKLEDVGVGMDFSFGAETGAGLTFEGEFMLGSKQLDEKFAITLDFDDDLPNPSLLYVESQNLSLSTLFDALISSSIKLPSVLSGFEFKDLIFYWCDRAQVLPDGTSCDIGVGYNAAINFWGFDTYSALMVSEDSGISGMASIDPISLLDGKISVTGDGKAGHGVKAGGAYFDFDTSKESFDASLDAKIFGLTEDVSAAISSDSFKISMETNLGFLDDKIEVHFSSLTDMGFSSSVDVDINVKPTIKIGSWKLGKIHVDSSLSGAISVTVSGSSFKASVSGSFKWNSHSFGFKYDVSEHLSDLKDLASAIEKTILSEAESIFSDYFKEVGNYIDAIGKGILTGGDFILNVLYHVYEHSVSGVIKEIADLPSHVHIDGDPDFKIKIKESMPSTKFHADLGHLLNVHVDFLVHEHADLKASHTFSTPKFDVTLLDINVGEHFDMVMPPSVHADTTSPHIDESVHLDVSLVGGKLGVGGKVGVNTKVALDDIKLKGDLDASAHVGAHADVAHIGKHADTSTHIDESV